MNYTIRTATIADIPHIVRHRELMFRDMNIQALFEEMAAGMESWLRHAIPSHTYRGWMAVTDGGGVVGVAVARWLPSPVAALPAIGDSKRIGMACTPRTRPSCTVESVNS